MGESQPYMVEYEDANRNVRRAVVDEQRRLEVTDPPEVYSVGSGRWVSITEIVRHPENASAGTARGLLTTPP